MLYEPPKQWTETAILKLSGEDDRYEFKSGRILFDETTNEAKTDNKLSNELSREICAFANSFGGTLFLGIKNNKKIDGVSKYYKGKQSNPIKEWLEKKIGQFLEFRLPNFRVAEVTGLSKETKLLLGEDKVIIAIDIFESDLAPHQCKFDHRYYFRQSSNSNPAPHHYLAYLWSRTNTDMSKMVGSWFHHYLNDLIFTLQQTANEFDTREFNSVDIPIKNSQVSIRNFEFFNLDRWNALNSGLTAKHFLRTYPALDSKIAKYKCLIIDFFGAFLNLEKLVSQAPEFERRIRVLLDEVINREKITEDVEDKTLDDVLRLFAGLVFDRTLTGISNNPLELKNQLIRATAYNLLDLEFDTSSRFTILHGYSKDQIANHFDESVASINKCAKEVSDLMVDIAKKSSELHLEADELRYSLAVKHNTSYEQGLN